MQVTARELKLRLGRYLEAVRRGDTIRVTSRGKPIAEIRPAQRTEDERLAALAAEGKVTLGQGGPLPPVEPATGVRSGSEMVLADRADERP